jgi:hypothetical protein
VLNPHPVDNGQHRDQGTVVEVREFFVIKSPIPRQKSN